MTKGCQWQEKKFAVSMSPGKGATMTWVPEADRRRMEPVEPKSYDPDDPDHERDQRE